MIKRFKSKKQIKYDLLFRYIVVLLFGYIIIRLCILCINVDLLCLTFSTNKIGDVKKYIVDKTINKPVVLLSYYISDNKEETLIKTTYIINNRPLVYIYNTHQKEAYKDKKTVLDAAKLMKNELLKYKVDTIVEKGDITEFMKANNISYSYSYYASKFFVKDAISKHNFDLVIDLHRDATKYNVSTTTINKKKYARIMFVVGKEHKNYKANYSLAIKLNKLIVNKYPTLSRGVILKSGANVNGIYNQNLGKNIVLIEIGGNNNSYLEVSNTIKLISKILGEHLYAKKNN